MLARSSPRDALVHIPRMVSGTNRWEGLVASLQPDGDDDQERENKSSTCLPTTPVSGLGPRLAAMFRLECLR